MRTHGDHHGDNGGDHEGENVNTGLGRGMILDSLVVQWKLVDGSEEGEHGHENGYRSGDESPVLEHGQRYQATVESCIHDVVPADEDADEDPRQDEQENDPPTAPTVLIATPLQSQEKAGDDGEDQESSDVVETGEFFDRREAFCMLGYNGISSW